MGSWGKLKVGRDGELGGMSGLAAGLVADAVDEVDDFVDAGVIVVGMRDVDGFVGEIDVDLFDAADAAAHSFDGVHAGDAAELNHVE